MLHPVDYEKMGSITYNLNETENTINELTEKLLVKEDIEQKLLFMKSIKAQLDNLLMKVKLRIETIVDKLSK